MKNSDSSPRVLGIIPARGGSKRLPRKNVRMLAGHPLIAHTILAARKATRLTDFLVTSEDEEIIEVAKRYEAPVPFVRPDSLAGDEVRNIETVYHALEFMEERKGIPYDMVVLLQPTCPIRSPGHIDEAIDRLWESPMDTLASVKGPFKKRDPVIKQVVEGVLVPYCMDKKAGYNEPYYLYNASIYAAKRDYFRENRMLISERQVPLVMDRYHSIDIDEEDDLTIAEIFMNKDSLAGCGKS